MKQVIKNRKPFEQSLCANLAHNHSPNDELDEMIVDFNYNNSLDGCYLDPHFVEYQKKIWENKQEKFSNDQN